MAGRTVVISGGGTGIGLATAHAFARDGDTAVLVGRRAAVLERAAEAVGGAVACPADLTDPAGADRVARRVGDRFGAVDVLVLAAGGTDGTETGDVPADPLATVAREWTAHFRRNVLTAVLLTEALRDRLASPGGRVLFVSSAAACRGGAPAAHTGAKAALHPYAVCLARDLGPRGVTVNVVAPGPVDGAGAVPHATTDAFDGRTGRPGDVAATLHWLASPAAAHITAQTLMIDGGASRPH
ncbi:SDR family oxidoreductase [Streptomyces sp. RFCAC02]|uniref:SDR family NAD(P)-dependent oxidoreductase n=1 Tax=Streptomyces sp. RFCAC02 TaxID=2499143 RepID=UPI0010211107|nr:SDR family oxidoreductase [Streptomyces sp. RFCAC02]